ncbi:unnamed protein product [Strongylus vulgaris]|uniref:Uncharacterized protein n=1 Tax=Strongylus vulgaris TaxID=40348 RepID=A0A3P7J2K0_STRVU|nr:unnamed protein product [Strongylus vulgaris]
MKQIEGEKKEKKAEQDALDALRELKAQKEHLEKDLNELRRELEEKEVQNNLLKDSEARLLDSVDEYGAQAERYQQETERLQKVVDVLEKERNTLEQEVEEKVVDVLEKERNTLEQEVEEVKRSDFEHKQRQQETEESTSTASSIDSQEYKNIVSRLETTTAERNELRSRLEKSESQLNVSLQEKMAITRAYEQLRTRLAARRKAMAGSAETSRRSSVVASEVDIPEEPRRSEEPAPSTTATYYSHQVRMSS